MSACMSVYIFKSKIFSRNELCEKTFNLDTLKKDPKLNIYERKYI